MCTQLVHVLFTTDTMQDQNGINFKKSLVSSKIETTFSADTTPALSIAKEIHRATSSVIRQHAPGFRLYDI